MSGGQTLGISKAADAFRTISEVAEELDIPQHVLRFWETRFSSIRPLKRGGGRRYYRPDDVELLKGIRQLLYGQGYTIKGVQRILKEEGARLVQDIGRGGALPLQRPVEASGYESDETEFDSPSPHVPASDRMPAGGMSPSVGEPVPADDTPRFLRMYEASLSSRAVAETPAVPLAETRLGHDRPSRADLDRLRSALAELHECQRVLEGLKRR